MGRAGGGGGGHHVSSGGHSAGRVSGGHRASSGGSRAGGGSFGRSSYGRGGGAPRSGGPYGGHAGPGMPPPPPPRSRPPHRGYHGGYVGPGMPPPPPPRRRPYRGYRGGYGGGCLTTAIVTFFLIVCLYAVFVGFSAREANNIAGAYSSNNQSSTIVRDKLETNNAYINDCIVDELGWFDNVSKTESRLKNFWEETGVQPYIILRDYDADLSTDSEKEQWAEDYYEENFDTENIFLFVYFAEKDTDNDVGYMAYVDGKQTLSVMDSEAVEIFWGNIDKYWYTDLSTDDVFVNAFNDTANTIMHVATTGKDIMKWVLIVVAIIIVGVIVINLVKQKIQRAKEEAEEAQKILNTPINDMANDNLEDKYL